MTRRSRPQPQAEPRERAAPAPGLDRVPRALSVAVIVVILFAAALIRLRLAGAPLERDEGEYAYAGQLVLQGVPPYQLAYNMKFPETYYAYSINKWTTLTFDYQFVVDPAYNADRGPVSIFATRLHAEF